MSSFHHTIQGRVITCGADVIRTGQAEQSGKKMRLELPFLTGSEGFSGSETRNPGVYEERHIEVASMTYNGMASGHVENLLMLLYSKKVPVPVKR